MTDTSMSDLIAIAEGKVITGSEARHRIESAVKKHGIESELGRILDVWDQEYGGQSKTADVNHINRFLKKEVGDIKVSKKKQQVGRDIADLARFVKDHGIADRIMDMIDTYRVGGKRDKAGRVLKGVKRAMFGESILHESDVSDDVVRDFFELLVQNYGDPTTSEGITESIVDDFLDTKLDRNKLNSIMSTIEDNNQSGAFNAVKDSILSKWGDSAFDTSTLRSISDELTTLSQKGLDI